VRLVRAKIAVVLFALFATSLAVVVPQATANDPTIITSTGGTATYSATTGRYYEYVGQAVDFATAKAAAESARAKGWAGYLVTITSQAEVEITSSVSGNRSFWIGASDASSEGCWRWVNGTSSDIADLFFAAPMQQAALLH
jgi:hypothetical protein